MKRWHDMTRCFEGERGWLRNKDEEKEILIIGERSKSARTPGVIIKWEGMLY